MTFTGDPFRQEARAIGAAVQFLTVFPLSRPRDLTTEDLSRAVGYFPLIGLAMGGILTGLTVVLEQLVPPSVGAILVLAIWIGLHGALHLDGFLDACDGLFGGHTREDRLRILRDERVGAFAVTGGVLLLLLKYATLASLWPLTPAVFIAPVLGRWAMSLAVCAFPYARLEGLGSAMKEHSGGHQVALATGITLVAIIVTGYWLGLIAMGFAAAVTLAIAGFAMSQLSALTGDIYGAICEVVEAMLLLFFVVAMGV